VSAMNYIGTHIAGKVYFDDLAERAGYSRQHFARLFREYSGYGFRDYVDRVRMELFRKMYFVKYMRKNEIARELGFSSSSSLIHWLRSVQDKHPEQNVTARARRHGDKGTI
jgi:transcriptional regulator GlxA family with amidase domain